MHLFVSQVITFPSNPDVTNSLVLVSYSMFLTQLVWPCKVQTLVLRFRRSQSATVVSSEQVAKSLLSRNLMLLTQSSWASDRVLICFEDTGSNKRTSVCSHATVNTDPSGEYSRLKAAPWVLDPTESCPAGCMEPYRLVITQ